MDGTEDTKDPSAVTQDASTVEQETSKTPRTYTEEEVKKAKSDALAAAGRDAKSLEKREKALEAEKIRLSEGLKRIEDWEKERERAEEDAVKDNPEALDVVKQKRTLKEQIAEHNKKVADFEEEKSEHEQEIQEAREAKLEVTVWRIAQKHGIDPETLKTKAQRFNLSTEEDIDDLAQSIKPAGTTTTQPLTPDSNRTTGNSTDYSGLSPRKKIEAGLLKQSKNK